MEGNFRAALIREIGRFLCTRHLSPTVLIIGARQSFTVIALGAFSGEKIIPSPSARIDELGLLEKIGDAQRAHGRCLLLEFISVRQRSAFVVKVSHGPAPPLRQDKRF